MTRDLILEASETPKGECSEFELHSDLVTLSDRRPTEAEAIRTIRTHVIARHLEEGRRGLAVCAPTAGAGCTFVAANLAVALSQVGVATLLIDGDMRRPGIDRLIASKASAQGLRQRLSDPERSSADGYVHPDVLPNLSVMFAGGQSDNAQELLGGEGFRDFMDRCLRDYEFTIIDTPPSNDSADALRIVSVVGYALVVARTDVTLLRDLSGLSRQIQENGGRIVGSIVNEF